MDPQAVETRLRRRRPGARRGVFPLERLVSNAFLSATERSTPCVIFVLADHPAPLALSLNALRLTVYPSAKVSLRGRVTESAIAAIEFTEPPKLRLGAFLLAEMTAELEASPKALSTSRQVLDHLEAWRKAFELIHELSPQEVTGLWGELEVLSLMGPSDAAVECWHGPEAAVFDFSGNGRSVEVKTSTRGHEHDFALEQLIAPGATELFVASLWIREDRATGETLTEKADRVAAKLSSRGQFDRKLMSLGLDPTEPRRERYSLRDLLLYPGSAVPTALSDDPAVSKVRFRSNLIGIAAVPDRKAMKILRLLAIPSVSARGRPTNRSPPKRH
jgi:hypothetical protein